jgi:hypothetical protein
MAELAELYEIFTEQDYRYLYQRAKATATCILCGARALLFRGVSSQLEYRVSALCQECQEKHLNGHRFVPEENSRNSFLCCPYPPVRHQAVLLPSDHLTQL